jgi:uncharacterized protein (DUF1501 family)
MTTRRAFMQSMVGSTALVGFAPSLPQILMAATRKPVESSEQILVVVQLAGGNDGLNTVIPFRNEEYYKNRYTLGIGREAVLKVNDDLGLHPAMNGFSEMLEKGWLTIINGVGYPQPNRSHFESMDLWHTAHHNDQRIREGWLGAALSAKNNQTGESKPETDGLNRLPGLHLGGEDKPLALASGSLQIPSARDLNSFRLREAPGGVERDRLKEMLNTSRGGGSLLSFVQANQQSAWQTSEEIERVLQTTKNSSAFPNTGLGEKLATVARLIGANLPTQVYYLSLDGFDTHKICCVNSAMQRRRS